jgi:hypothetical protein
VDQGGVVVIESSPLQGNAVLVDALSSALRRGGNALAAVPDLLIRILEEESWQEFVTQRGERVSHQRFADFVIAPPLRGLGGKPEQVREMIQFKPRALDLFDRAMQRSVGRPKTRDNVTNSKDSNLRGTSKDYALRRLRKDSPHLHAEVIAGTISAHAAMVQAGFRPNTFTIRADSAESVAATLKRRLPPEMLAEIAAQLA